VNVDVPNHAKMKARVSMAGQRELTVQGGLAGNRASTTIALTPWNILIRSTAQEKEETGIFPGRAHITAATASVGLADGGIAHALS
jgi:hypothetical protein